MNRYIIIAKIGEKYSTQFWQDEKRKWDVTSYIIEPHEVMVAWIEKGLVPVYSYR